MATPPPEPLVQIVTGHPGIGMQAHLFAADGKPTIPCVIISISFHIAYREDEVRGTHSIDFAIPVPANNAELVRCLRIAAARILRDGPTMQKHLGIDATGFCYCRQRHRYVSDATANTPESRARWFDGARAAYNVPTRGKRPLPPVPVFEFFCDDSYPWQYMAMVRFVCPLDRVCHDHFRRLVRLLRSGRELRRAHLRTCAHCQRVDDRAAGFRNLHCTCCRFVYYCSVACQRADRALHVSVLAALPRAPPIPADT
jgi:hypothetical protein